MSRCMTASLVGLDRGAAGRWPLLRWGVVQARSILTIGSGASAAPRRLRPRAALAQRPRQRTWRVGADGELRDSLARWCSRRPRVWARVGAEIGGRSRGSRPLRSWRSSAGPSSRPIPADGFPPGTPAGVPTTDQHQRPDAFRGWRARLLPALSGFASASTLRRRAPAWLARLSLFSGLTVVLGFFGGIALGVLGF